MSAVHRTIGALALAASATLAPASAAQGQRAMHVVSGKWYDDSWWEIDVPEPWNVTERSTEHIRFTNAGAKALVGFRKECGIHPASTRDAWAAANLPPAQEWAYSAAKTEHQYSRWRVPLLGLFSTGKVERTEVSKLVGWTHVTWADFSTKKWAGYFTQEPWCVYLRLESPAAELQANRTAVMNVLASIRFRK
jgi:hypothetical protein